MPETTAILDALGSVLTRWTMGGAASTAAPSQWRSALGDEPQEAELRLLALSGEFLGALVLPEASGKVQVRADLPRLAKPALPDVLRSRARRVLAELRDTARRRTFLDFVDGRGWTLHPADWLPGQAADAPDVYAPWQDWVTNTDATQAEDMALTAESWSLIPPAVRRVAFAKLRRQDPAAAAALLAEKIGGEPADVRVRLIEVLVTGLSDADRPMLEALGSDRAPRVQALVASLLERLGHGADGKGDDAAELAAFFRVETKGFLRRTRMIALQDLKTPAQQARRLALMDELSFGLFAQALGLTTDDLVALWPWGGDIAMDRSLAGMAARSAPDSIVFATANAIASGEGINMHGIAPLVPRLSLEQRRAIAVRVLQTKDGTFVQALDVVGGDGRIPDPMRTSAGATLLKHLKVAAEVRPGDPRPRDCVAELFALGLIASRDGARKALEQSVAAGMMPSDPRFDMLRLNIDLDDRGATG